MSQLWQLGAVELAEVIVKRDASSRQAVESLLARIDAVNPHLNAVVDVVADRALAAADRADEAVAEGTDALGPLHGVPFTVKENIDLAGSATTHGVVALEQAVAGVDAPVVERLRAAGAIPLARTNMPDFGLRVHTDSSLRGLTRNPWNPHVTAGGSSGGEASALASGMSPLGLGNDIGGSLRNPAHCCGIAAVKPSTGVVPHASCLPPEDQTIMFQLMAVEGVMARRVADVRAGLLAVAGAHRRDPVALPVALPEPSPGTVLRIAALPEPPAGTTDAGIAGAIRATADALADAGHVVDDVAPPGYARAIDVWAELLLADVRALRPLLDEVMGLGGRTFLDHAEKHYPVLDAATVTMLHLERNALDRQWHEFLTDWDVVLTPTWAQPAFAHGADIETYDGAVAVLATVRPVLPANLLGLPAAVVPCAVADGLPVGAHFTARRFADHWALAAAQTVEDAVGTFTPIDPILGVTGRLVALDLPGGPAFVDALRVVWDRNDAAFPVDQRLPAAARAALISAMEPASAIDASGTETELGSGRPVEPDDALVVATSGSTGTPRGVVLTHDAVEASARATSARLGVTEDDHWLACLPLAHVGGLAVVTRAMKTGTALTVHPGFDVEAVERSGATLVALVATALARIDATRFRTIVVGGAPAPIDRPPNVVTTYGMTETGSGIVYDGRPLDGVEVRIDTDGEIHVRGPMLLRAYRDGHHPLRDGWLATDDLGHWRTDGRLHVEGRRGELIITGGENVWPQPVEAALAGHPAVADVAVAGLPDPEWGHLVTAFVVPAGAPPTIDALREHAKEQLAPFAAPRRLVLVRAIPRTSLGKIRRAALARLVPPDQPRDWRTNDPPSMT